MRLCGLRVPMAFSFHHRGIERTEVHRELKPPFTSVKPPIPLRSDSVFFHFGDIEEIEVHGGDITLGITGKRIGFTQNRSFGFKV